MIRVNCKECLHHWDEKKVMCEACKRMQAEGRWKWEIDNGHRVIRCPKCGGGMVFGYYFYENPYRYCPYCGEPMITHKQIKLDVDVL